jgi:hypothetical protein
MFEEVQGACTTIHTQQRSSPSRWKTEGRRRQNCFLCTSQAIACVPLFTITFERPQCIGAYRICDASLDGTITQLDAPRAFVHVCTPHPRAVVPLIARAREAPVCVAALPNVYHVPVRFRQITLRAHQIPSLCATALVFSRACWP